MKKDIILYHYCSNHTAVSIIEHQQLWMCDITSSNDYSETQMLIPDLYYAIEEAYGAKPFSFEYGSKKDLEGIRLLLHNASYYIDSTYKSGILTNFVVCLSEDGDKLSQWRGYSNDGKGCAIGFSERALKAYCKQFNGVIRMEKVAYVNLQKMKLIVRKEAEVLLGKIKGLRSESVELFGGGHSNEIIEVGMCIRLFRYLEETIMESLKYKWESFKEEREWRLFFNSITKDEAVLFDVGDKTAELIRKDDIGINLLSQSIGFHVREDCIVPYYPLGFQEMGDDVIKKVIIGPKNNTRKQDLRIMLAKYGLNSVDVQYSDITYR